ncbi:MAG: metallophosphoesterase, partial [Dehalococcoidia bacterium]
YVLSISYIPDGSSRSLIQNDHFGLLARDSSGKWVNAVTMNSGGIEKFVTGAWDPIYKLGTCGVDTTTNTAWAVINYNGDFAAGQFPSFQK